jgi:type II secretory pathway pseudopilin PulG
MDDDAAAILVINLIVRSICGGIAAAIASHKGRSGVGWFFAGFFIVLLGIIIVACLSNLNEERRRDQSQQQENRRLREQLLQEQVKNEAFRRHAMARLDTHDNQLGVDTRSVVSALPAPDGTYSTPPLEDQSQSAFPSENRQQDLFGPPQQDGFGAPQNQVPVPQQFNVNANADTGAPRDPRTDSAPRVRVGPTREWHYEYQGSTRGPISDRQLVELAREGRILGTTLVWTEQLGDWKPAQQVKALQPYLRG